MNQDLFNAMQPEVQIEQLIKNGITDACSIADCCPLLTICPRCCPRHTLDMMMLLSTADIIDRLQMALSLELLNTKPDSKIIAGCYI